MRVSRCFVTVDTANKEENVFLCKRKDKYTSTAIKSGLSLFSLQCLCVLAGACMCVSVCVNCEFLQTTFGHFIFFPIKKKNMLNCA